jgi:gamma-glutamyltranspeptidase/glutathione hydrolase
VLRMLELAHKDYGRTAWPQLFNSGIDLASKGFPISGRMAAALDGSKVELARDADAAKLYFDAFYRGDLAQAIVSKVGVTQAVSDGAPITPGKTTLQDLASYEAKRREAVCTTYRARYVVCSMPPPSSGGIAVAQAMGILENFDLKAYAPTAIDGEGGKPSVKGVHLVSEALRLA